MCALSERDVTPPKPLLLPGAVVALGAFLLFVVQPLVARALLPRFGGTSLVWSASVLCFQALLLAGYAYAHHLPRLSPLARRGLHLALLGAAVALLPISPGLSASQAFAAEGSPALAVVKTVLAAVGLPALVLATTSPNVARQLGTAPYRLYALSNAASLAALLAYPVVIEPWLTLSAQADVFSVLFALYAVLAALLAWRDTAPRGHGAAPDGVAAPESVPTAGPAARLPWVRWLVLSALPSGLFLAVTNHLCVNVAPMPLLWVLPLALYLGSLILCFDHPRWYRRMLFVGLLPVALGVLGVLQIELLGHMALAVQFVPSLAALFVACMAGHGELAALRPGPTGVTGFYLAISFGGALGGLFVGLVAPLIFDGPVELPILLLALGAAILWALKARPTAGRASIRARSGGLPSLERTVAGLLALFVGLFAMLALSVSRSVSAASLFRARNAYGSLRVSETSTGGETVRSLIHGVVRHGAHRVSPERRHEKSTYFRPSSGVGRALQAAEARGPLRLGVVGLGTGSLADWLRPGDSARFYEINPLVEDVARRWFWALPEAKAPVEVILGDGRLALAADSESRFDVLAIDAFNSDAVPTHLMTTEAFAVYRARLAVGGVLAVNVSNHYLNLDRVIAGEVSRGGWEAVLVRDPAGDDVMAYASRWALLAPTGTGAFSGPLFEGTEPLGGPAVGATTAVAWTDERAPLWGVLRWE